MSLQEMTRMMTRLPKSWTIWRNTIEMFVVTEFWRTPQSSAMRLTSSPVRFSSKKAMSCSMRDLKSRPLRRVTTLSPAIVKSAARMNVNPDPTTKRSSSLMTVSLSLAMDSSASPELNVSTCCLSREGG